MNSVEREELKRLPKKYRPMRPIGFVLYSVFWAIPLIGWISLIRTMIKGKNICRRNYARSYVVAYLLIVLAVIFAAINENLI